MPVTAMGRDAASAHAPLAYMYACARWGNASCHHTHPGWMPFEARVPRTLPPQRCCLQIDLMKEQGFLDKKFNRRRDEFVLYVEASCKMAHLTKGPVAQK